MRRPWFFASLAFLVLTLSGFTCVQIIDESHHACPCAAGWTCCSNPSICVRDGESCPAPACTPDCSNDRCGPDGCGGSCKPCQCGEETCPSGEVCTPVGRCGIFREASRPAKVMLVLDRSASMLQGSTDDPRLDCKWNDLKHVIAGSGGFIDGLGNRARIGLTFFPDLSAADSDACTAGNVAVEVPDTPGFSTGQIVSMLDASQATPFGGTPTSSTLKAVLADDAFTREEPATQRFVILVTDGLPNCNPAIANCSACMNGESPASSCGGDPKSCLDYDDSMNAVRALRAKGVYTAVVGFGSQTIGLVATDVLNDMATQGGMARDGSRKFFQAADAKELGAILQTLVSSIGTCVFKLSQAPQHPERLEVVLTDTSTRPSQQTVLTRDSEWRYSDSTNTEVAITGSPCRLMQAAEPGRYTLSFLARTEL